MIIAAGALSRAVPLALAWSLPYARSGPGTGRALTESLSFARAACGVALASAFAVGVAGRTGLLMLGGVALVTVASGVGLRSWLGGVTGDTLGAAIEASEAFAFAVAVGA